MPSPTKPARTLLITGTHLWNPGDDWVRQGIIRVLRASVPEYDLNFLFYDFNPEEVRSSNAVREDNRVCAGELEALAPHLDAIVIAGLSAGAEVKPLYDGIVRAGLLDRLFLLGAGYENDYAASWMQAPSVQAIFRHAKVVTGRTRKHPKALDELGVDYRHVNCPAILAVPEVKEVVRGAPAARILFSMQLPHGYGVSNQTSGGAMFDLSCRALQNLTRTHEVATVAHHKSELLQLRAMGLEAFGPIHFSSFESDLASLYPRFDAVITTRLHAGLYANGHGLPAIILNHTDRHTHCLEGFTHAWWASDPGTLDGHLAKLASLDLRQAAAQLGAFKGELEAQYVAILRPPLRETLARGEGRSEGASVAPDARLPIHFFTIVLNGEPFIRHHLEVFRQLPFPWHWHVVEGVAELKHDTAWSLKNGARIPDHLHRLGRSTDGTTEYLDGLPGACPGQVTLYRKPGGQFWDGKLEMVNAPLANLPTDCLLWQVDADELWTVEQVQAVRAQFLARPEKQAAFFWCHFFVGPGTLVTTRGTYGNHGRWEWLRVHRFRTGCRWVRHEPPELADPTGKILSKGPTFSQDEMEACGAVFHHMAYVTEAQLAFKESYYGYQGAVAQWRSLQDAADHGEVRLRDHFAWVTDEARVGACGPQGVVPLAFETPEGVWTFRTHGLDLPKGPALRTWQVQTRRLARLLGHLRARARRRWPGPGQRQA